MLDPLYLENAELNKNIFIEKLATIIMHTKNNSFSGYDSIPYEVLKFPPVIEILHKLFQLIFDTSIIPSIWRKSVICPIHKEPTSDKTTPLNYRGISLLSCVSKVYSAFINKRRSCKDRIFVLNSLIRNKANIFTAFIAKFGRLLSSLLVGIFETDHRLCNNNWCSEIKNIMNRLELVHDWKLFVAES